MTRHQVLMKKLLFISGILLLSSGIARAQHFSLSAGGGWMPATYFRDAGLAGSAGFETGYPTYNLNAFYNIDRNLFATASILFEHTRADGKIDGPPFTPYHEVRNTYGCLLGLGYSWISHRCFTFYSYIEGGLFCATIREEGYKEKQDNNAAIQINTLGFGFGNKIGGFLELGYGIKGIVNMGAFVKL